MIKVSVIIPVYNTAPYLRACLDSIVGQTLQDIEIICINDGSKDESPEILNEYAKRDSRVSVYSQDNSGLSSVRNRGVRFAHGKYLYFIDSDDLIEKDALRQLWDMSEKKALDVLYFDADCFADSEDCREICEEKREYYERKGDYGGVYEGQLLFKSFLDNEEYRVNVGIQFINREFFISADLWFIEGILHEDEFFTFKTMLSAKRASHLKRKLFHRRYRSGSVMTSKQSFGDAYGHFRSYLEMCGFIEKIRLLEKCKTSALEIIRRRITNARDIYENLQDDEREKYLVLSQYERMIFKLYVVDYERLRKDSKDKFEISEKLKQAYEEKSEINAKLKTAYEEKSEINAKLKTAYEEKSEINAKLKQAYEEKSEINAKLKLTVEEKAKLSESLEQERKEKKKLEEEFAARSAEALLAAKREREALAAQIRGTYSYRLGAIILYIPQRIVKIINRIKVRRSR